MYYSNSMKNLEAVRQADLERIVRRALRVHSSRSALAQRVVREAEELAAKGYDAPRTIREIVGRLSRELTAARRADSQPFAGTVLGGTILVA